MLRTVRHVFWARGLVGIGNGSWLVEGKKAVALVGIGGIIRAPSRYLHGVFLVAGSGAFRVSS